MRALRRAERKKRDALGVCRWARREKRSEYTKSRELVLKYTLRAAERRMEILRNYVRAPT
jgi:hypothetical protein